MSPEQARGRPIDGRADLYSLGIVLHEMLLGRVPYHADDSLAVGIKHITEPLPQLPQSFAALQPLLDRLLAKEPEDRFQTGNEVAAAITEIERDLPDGGIAPSDARDDGERTESWPSMRSSDTPPIATKPMFAVDARERAEPAIGRIDQIGAALDAEPMRADRDAPLAREARKPRRRGGIGAALALVLLAGTGLLAWHYQDALRRLLPHTEFNDTLTRAQHGPSRRGVRFPSSHPRVVPRVRLRGCASGAARQLQSRYRATRHRCRRADSAVAGAPAGAARRGTPRPSQSSSLRRRLPHARV